MKRGVVLHLQKVAGISGSEAHLLALLPKLRERGWDVRMLMLHENEPGAWEFARALTARGVPLDSIPLRADVDPIAFVRLVAYLVRMRPAILHTHLVHADAYGLLAGTAARVPVRFSTKHGFNEFREAPYFGFADRSVAALAHVHIAISRGLARYLEDVEGFDGESFEIVHYGIDPDGEPSPYADEAPRLLCVGRLIPIKGHIVLLRAFAEAKRDLPELQLDIAGRGPLEPALKAVAGELGHRRLGALPRPREPDPGGDRACGGRRRPVDGRGLRDGRARGDGACAAGDRRRDRRSRRARPRRRDGPARPGRARRSRCAPRSSASPATSSSRAGWARPGGGARSRASSSSSAPTAPSCSTRARSSTRREPQSASI